MKQLLKMLGICLFLGFLPSLTDARNEVVVVAGAFIEDTPNTYMTALFVNVEVQDANGNILGRAKVQPGETVSFVRTGAEKKVVEEYHMSDGIIIGDIIIQ